MRRQWFNKRKSITALLREIMNNQPSQLLDSDADHKVVDADLALQALGGDHVAFGYLKTTITVTDTDWVRVEDKVRQVGRIVNGFGFTTIREGGNAVEAGSRRCPARHMPMSASRWSIRSTSRISYRCRRSRLAPRATPISTDRRSSMPARGDRRPSVSTHGGDVDHMLVVGPTGAGKSVLLVLIALQFRRYAGSQVYIFDKGFSARAPRL